MTTPLFQDPLLSSDGDLNTVVAAVFNRIHGARVDGVATPLVGAHLKDGVLTVVLDAQGGEDFSKAPWRGDLEQALSALKGVSNVRLMATVHRPLKGQKSSACGSKTPPGAAGAPGNSGGGVPKLTFPSIGHLIAVGSGKGGVGKSAVTVNLAYALADQGFKVGILDADVYGPSLPTMMGVSDRPTLDGAGRLLPIKKNGLSLMSMGFFMDPYAPLIWRGPMVQSSLTQLFRDVAWGTLDVLLIDLPPGTGDAQLMLAQKIPLSGAIIVSTPQDLAFIDARKGLAMFQTLHVPIVGLIENMHAFHCPHCAKETFIFGAGALDQAAADLDVPYLGAIPLDMAVRVAADGGTPLPPGTSAHGAFQGIGGRLADYLSKNVKISN